MAYRVKITSTGQRIASIVNSPPCANGYKRHSWEDVTVERRLAGLVEYSFCEHCDLRRQRMLDCIVPEHYAVSKISYYHMQEEN